MAMHVHQQWQSFSQCMQAADWPAKPCNLHYAIRKDARARRILSAVSNISSHLAFKATKPVQPHTPQHGPQHGKSGTGSQTSRPATNWAWHQALASRGHAQCQGPSLRLPPCSNSPPPPRAARPLKPNRSGPISSSAPRDLVWIWEQPTQKQPFKNNPHDAATAPLHRAHAAHPVHQAPPPSSC